VQVDVPLPNGGMGIKDMLYTQLVVFRLNVGFKNQYIIQVGYHK